MNELLTQDTLVVRQERELAELFGFETRNKYRVRDTTGRELFFIAEQQKGLLGFIFRSYLGHWRPFSLHVFNPQREKILEAVHPFSIWLQRMEINEATGRRIGHLQQRFTIFRKKLDLMDERGQLLMEVKRSLFGFWTYKIFRGGHEVARIEKKFSGFFKELFTDADTFLVRFLNAPGTAGLDARDRTLIMTTAIFVDLLFFEQKAG